MQAIVLVADDTPQTHPLAPDAPTATLPVGRGTAVEHAVRVADAADADCVTLVDPDGVRSDSGVSDPLGSDASSTDTDSGRAPTLDTALAAREDDFVLLPASVFLDARTVASLVQRAPSVAVALAPLPRRDSGRSPPGDAVARSETEPRYGVVDADGGRVREIRRTSEGGAAASADSSERGDSNQTASDGALAFTGALSLPADCRSAKAEFDALVAAGVDAGLGTVTADRWHDLERPWGLLEANEHALGELAPRRDGRVHPDAVLSGSVVVESGAVVESGVVVEGPALVSRGATVGPNAYLRGATYLGPDAHVGHAVEVKNSVLLAGATVGHLSYVGDSLLGRNVNFGANTVVANLRHDDESVRAAAGDRRLSTGRRKFGVVAGEGVKTGIGTNLNAGVTLGPGAHTTPGETVLRDR